ncbi:hypothetical protein Poli38472_014410 [Pythium oligandrum]|uniref:Structural maintenance of chromosomes protein n=1 Tax=Pythium oligandrum TaxID=41045 RepID=A0A8K1C894_PYTOL|nr:hypothetical protein Poli38472_014410 [Pythium oligandrum]|eukprot:TMW57807.1 hypothetical protein Poli38472_014410 [Pythium oligandrum]
MSDSEPATPVRVPRVDRGDETPLIGVRSAVATPSGTRLMITKMQLENFKSYAGRVEIGPFHKCFSAVVGPNGSGKSNVIDALLFVFGKRASKLRLKKVSELVHRSASYPDLDTATVSVFFQEIYDEGARAQTSGLAVEGEEDDEGYRVVPNSQLVVTRTASKSNVSKYFVNDKPSNFTQVTALLREKGIDLDNNRFLILQGEVEQIAMMKSKGDGNGNEDGLLEYLEDIIGSNVYVEPTERVWQEVEECNDVRNEKVQRVKLVEREKAHLEGPRAEALEYLRKEKEVYIKTNILYQLWIQEASKNRALCETRKEELQAQYQAELEKMQANRAELEKVEAIYKTFKDEHDKCVEEMEATKAVYADFEKQDIKLREELKFAKEKIKELEATKKKELKKQKDIQRKQKESDELVPQLEKGIEELQEQLKEQEQVLEAILQEHKAETATLRNEMEVIQQEMEPHRTELNSLRSVIDTTETEIQLIQEPVTSAKKALEANSIGIKDAEQSIKQLTKQQDQQKKELREMKSRVEEAASELETVRRNEAGAAERYREARGKADEASSSSQSHATRNRMLKSLLDASRSGGPLSKAGLFGRLGDLGAIDDKYDVAISTACGALDHLVVATTSGAQACVQYLRKHNLGRTTFLILEQLGYLESKYSQQFRSVKAPSGQTAPRLFDLVKVNDKRFLPAFYFALRDTLVAKDLDEATAIAYQGSQCKYRVVTLDGQLVELSGAMSGGGNRVRSGGMSSSISGGFTEAEIAALQQEATEVKQELDKLREEKMSLEREVTALNRKIEQYENDVPKIELNLNASKTKLKDLSQLRGEWEKKGKISDAEKKKIAKLEKEKAAKEAEYSSVKQTVDDMEAQLAELKKKIMDVGGAKLRKEQEVATKISKDIEDKTKQMTKIRVEFKSSQKNQEKNAKLLESLDTESVEMKAKAEGIVQQCSDMEEKALEVLTKCQSLEADVQSKEEVLRKEEKKYNKLKKQFDSMRSSEVDLQNSLEDCEKVLEENAKKESYWTSKLTTLHANYLMEQEQNAGVFDDDEPEIPDGSARTKPKKKQTQKKKKKVQRKSKKLRVIDEEDDEEEKKEDEDTEMADPGDETEEADAEEDEEEDDEEDEDEDEEMSVDSVKALPMLDAKQLSKYNKEEMKYEISVLEQQRDELKANVNMGALVEYKQKEREYQSRVEELEEATQQRDDKRHQYDELRRKRLEEFMTGFRIITLKLKEMYQMITLGGDAELELVDSLDPFSEGVVFSVRPSKKSWKNISNLSGGEKTLASLALVFALHHYKPTPLYVMDEIDAALDFKNVSIVGNYIKQRTRNAQFVIISLRNNMFELADRLVGIYKTNDATKSVTINPKMYQNIHPSRKTPAAPPASLSTPSKQRMSMAATPSKAGQRASNDDGEGLRTPQPKRSRPNEEPLRDRTNQE